jgi:multidrug efflux pump subunit AcrB/outer membrane protein TolC
MAAALLILNGIAAWFTTPQEEDPQLTHRGGIVTLVFPGTPPDDMERLIAKPVEDELAQVEEIKKVTTLLRTDFMMMRIDLKDSADSEEKTRAAWDKVQDALDRAGRKLPETAWKPELNKEIYDQDAVLLAVSGGKDPLALLDRARDLKTRLQRLPDVKKVEEISSPGEQLSIVFDNEKLAAYGVSVASLVRQLQGGNALVPSGYIRVADRKVNILTNSFYKSSAELAKFPIILKSGDVLPLSSVARISRTRKLPVTENMRYNGSPGMALGVVPQTGTNLNRFGADVTALVRDFEASPECRAAGLKVDVVSFQPRYVRERIHEIVLDLVKAVVLVGGVLMLMLGFRVGAIVALQVPVVTAIAFGLFSHTGGALNQISIAAFILAIGLLVDNVVVMVDGIQDKLDRGMPAEEAGARTRGEYLVPLAAGTLTTVAAFVPILLEKGVTADFTRSIGVVAAIALLCSYFFCIFVTPIIAARLLKKGKSLSWDFIQPLGARLGGLVQRWSVPIICCAFAAVVVAVLGFSLVKKQFFPFADRDMLIVDMQLPEGTHYRSTEENALRLEEAIRKDPRVVSVTSFIGRGVPQFYYNLPREPNSPHIAQFIVKTHDKKEAKQFQADRERDLQALVPYGTVILKNIAQGPPVKAPIEIRVLSEAPAKRQAMAEKVLAALRATPGVWKVRSTLGVGIMNYRLDVNDSAAGVYGVTRAEISGLILANTRGIPITTFRGGSDPYSVSLLSREGEESKIDGVRSAYMGSTRTDDLSIRTLTSKGVEFSPAVIEHYNRMPVVHIYGEIAPGATEDTANAAVKRTLAALPPMDGVKVEIGGVNSENASSNLALFMALPAGLMLLFVSLMFEFNSFRRVAIILVTVPLCAVGSVPGLLLTGSTFGFVTLLAFFTLAGTVIHNGIFLLDYMDHRVAAGVPLDTAITEGIQRRTRPIILTAVATIVELLPMTMSSSTLWPPFAWAIISGLAVSTLMTLLVLPSIYRLAFGGEARSVKGAASALLLGALALHAAMPVALRAQEAERQVTLAQVLDLAAKGPDAQAAASDADAADWTYKAVWRAGHMPKLLAASAAMETDRLVGISDPLSGLGLPIAGRDIMPDKRGILLGRVELQQPLLDVSTGKYAAAAAATLAEAARQNSAHEAKELQQQAAGYALRIMELRAKRAALENYVANLQKRRPEIQRLYELGALSEAETLKVKLGIDDAEQGIRELREGEHLLARLLARTAGSDVPLQLADLPEDLPAPAALPQAAPGDREDVRALSRKIEAAGLRAKAAEATLVPRVDAFAGYNYADQDVLTERKWADIGLRLTWPIYDGAVRSAAAGAASAEKAALERRKSSAELAIAAQQDSARRMLDLKRREYAERVRGVEEARFASELDFKRFKQGKITLNDLMDAEDMLKDRLEKAALSRVNWYQEWFKYQEAAGLPPSAP